MQVAAAQAVVVPAAVRLAVAKVVAARWIVEPRAAVELAVVAEPTVAAVESIAEQVAVMVAEQSAVSVLPHCHIGK